MHSHIVKSLYFIHILTLFIDSCCCNVSVTLPEDDAVRVATCLSM